MLCCTEKPFSRVRSLPTVTIALAAIAVVAQASVNVGQALAYDRAAILGGETWRLITGHLTHWSGDHLFWDVAMFMMLGSMIERVDRKGFMVSLIASSASISFVLWSCHPEIGQYRGLSGVDSALFTHAAVWFYREALQRGRILMCAAVCLAILGFAAKVSYELLSGNVLFVDSDAAGFVPIATVHAVGGLVGALSAISMWRSVSKGPASSGCEWRGGAGHASLDAFRMQSEDAY